jgi:type III restriction enzyme
LNMSPIRIHSVLASSEEGIPAILKSVNEFNELLYDWIIPRLFTTFYDIKEYKSEDEIEVELVKEPKGSDHYVVKADKNLVADIDAPAYSTYKHKSFHLDHYCFDSKPESEMFWALLKSKEVDKVWFTGMLTHGQSDFMINYIDPLSHTVRSYYPDFLIRMQDGTYVIMEVKGDHMIDDSVVKAKADYATQIASASKMKYVMVKGSEAGKGVVV